MWYASRSKKDNHKESITPSEIEVLNDLAYTDPQREVKQDSKKEKNVLTGKHISLNTYMAITKLFKVYFVFVHMLAIAQHCRCHYLRGVTQNKPPYRLSRSLDDDGSAWCQRGRRFRWRRPRRSKSEDNRLVVSEYTLTFEHHLSDLIST
jgi:hypothetical protein